MKSQVIILFLLLSILVYGQKINGITDIYKIGFKTDYNDFEKSGLKQFSSYLFKVKKNGKVLKDSLVQLEINFDGKSRTLNELSRISFLVISCSKESCNYNFSSPNIRKSISSYNEKGLLIKQVSEVINYDVKKKPKGKESEDRKDEITYKYDDNNNLIQEMSKEIVNSFSIIQKDTLFELYSINRPKIYYYLYNNKGLESKKYEEIDSTRYFNKGNVTSKYCNYCAPKRLDSESKYYPNNKIKEWILYASNGDFHSKRYYYYDENENLSKEIDSTGWYFGKYSSEYPKLESLINFKYKNARIIEKEIIKGNSKVVNYYDDKENLIKTDELIDGLETSVTYSYSYENDKISKIVSKNCQNNSEEVHFKYDNGGMLCERVRLYNSKTTELIRYFYH